MHIHFFTTSVLATLSSIPLQAHGLPALERRNDSAIGGATLLSVSRVSTSSVMKSFSATTFAPQTISTSTSFSSTSSSGGYVGKPQNTTGDLTCYQGQYISVQNFTLAVEYGCEQIGTRALAKGYKAWQTITTFVPPASSGPSSNPLLPGGSSPSSPTSNSNSTFTLTFAPQDPNKGQKAKINMYMGNLGTDDDEEGFIPVDVEICKTVAGVIMANCKNSDGNTGGGILTDGQFQMYVDGGVP